jgi:hypothetical protein
MRGSISARVAVAQLGREAESTAKVDPGMSFFEKRQQKRLQVMILEAVLEDDLARNAEDRPLLAAQLLMNNPSLCLSRGKWFWCAAKSFFETLHSMMQIFALQLLR